MPPKGSGGVGLLVKNWLYRTYNVDIIDKSFEGILGVQFHDKENDFTLVVYSVYLPPENSPRGRDASTFFSHLLTQFNSIQFNLFLSNHCMVHEVLYTICANIYNIHGTREL